MKNHFKSSALVSSFCALLFVWTLPAIERAPKSGVVSRPVFGKPVAQIPFEMNGNHIFLQGRINNSQPLWFTLDSGASGSVINRERAIELRLNLREGFSATGAGGTVESGLASNVTFKFAGLELRNLTVATIPLDFLENSAGRRMDVILGSELFKEFVVEIDYETRRLNLYDSPRFAYNGAGEILPLAFFDNHPYVRANITLEGQKPIEGDFVIDLGSNFGITLLPSFIEKHQILKSVSKTIKTRGRGVGGEIEMPIGRIKNLQLGRFWLDNPVTAFPAGGTFGRDGKAGNIGSAILRHFKVIFDYARRHIILEPNKYFEEPFEYDMSGLALTTDRPHFRNVKVSRVISDSPASEAGIKPDDEIVSINGRPASEYRLMKLREMFKLKGREYQLAIKRGGEALKTTLKTRRLI